QTTTSPSGRSELCAASRRAQDVRRHGGCQHRTNGRAGDISVRTRSFPFRADVGWAQAREVRRRDSHCPLPPLVPDRLSRRELPTGRSSLPAALGFRTLVLLGFPAPVPADLRTGRRVDRLGGRCLPTAPARRTRADQLCGIPGVPRRGRNRPEVAPRDETVLAVNRLALRGVTLRRAAHNPYPVAHQAHCRQRRRVAAVSGVSLDLGPGSLSALEGICDGTRTRHLAWRHGPELSAEPGEHL